MNLPPRFPLGLYPTPVFEAPRLSADLNLRLMFKDESHSHFGLGGNKVRAIEYLFADHQSWDCVVIAGSCHSNFVRIAVAAAGLLNKKAICAFYGREPETVYGNYLLQRQILRPEIRFSSDDARESCEALALKLKAEQESAGLRVKLVLRGGDSAEATFGFYQMQDEISVQVQAPVDHLIVPIGTGTMLSGLMIDAGKMSGIKKIWGISGSRKEAELRAQCARLAKLCAEKFNLSPQLKSNVEITDAYLGDGYHRVSDAELLQIRKVADAEGIFLDPTFGAKAFSGLIGLIGSRKIRQGESVLFINGGGAPELFQEFKFL